MNDFFLFIVHTYTFEKVAALKPIVNWIKYLLFSRFYLLWTVNHFSLLFDHFIYTYVIFLASGEIHSSSL